VWINRTVGKGAKWCEVKELREKKEKRRVRSKGTV